LTYKKLSTSLPEPPSTEGYKNVKSLHLYSERKLSQKETIIEFGDMLLFGA